MKLSKDEIKKIAIFRALQLGDMLCAIPGLRALRQLFPEAEVTLLGLTWAESLCRRFPHYIDRFVHFPGFPPLPEQSFDAASFYQFLGNMISSQFDLVLQMQGNGTFVNAMMPLFNARFQAGFYTETDYCPDKDLFIIYPEGIHETLKHLRLMQHLGATTNDASLEFPIYPEDELELEQLQLPVTKRRYVCVHPGSRGSWRQWPPQHFAALANQCTKAGLTVVLTGTKAELPIIHEVANYLDNPPVIAAGKTSIGAVAVLIRDAFALISNCTGVSHIAAAVKTPSIVISMDGEPERWAPLNHHLHRTIDWTKTSNLGTAVAALQALLKDRDSERRERSNMTVQHITDRFQDLGR